MEDSQSILRQNESDLQDHEKKSSSPSTKTIKSAPRWVDPLRNGDIFRRSWASPLPARARVLSQSPASIVQDDSRNAVRNEIYDKSLGPTLKPLQQDGFQKNKDDKSGLQQVQYSSPTSKQNASPLWAQKVRNSFENLVRESPMPRAVAVRLGLEASQSDRDHCANQDVHHNVQGGSTFSPPLKSVKPILKDDTGQELVANNVKESESSKRMEVSKWCLKMMPECNGNPGKGALPISISGLVQLNDEKLQLWTSGIIVQRKSSRKLIDANGIVIELSGEMEAKLTADEGLSIMIIRAFCSGFPAIWQNLLANSLALATPSKLVKNQSEPGKDRREPVLKTRRLSLPPPPLPLPRTRQDIDSAFDKKRRESIGGDKANNSSMIPTPPPGWHASYIHRTNEAEHVEKRDFRSTENNEMENGTLTSEEENVEYMKRKKQRIVKKLKGNHSNNSPRRKSAGALRELERLKKTSLTWGKHDISLTTDKESSISTKHGRRIRKPEEFWKVQDIKAYSPMMKVGKKGIDVKPSKDLLEHAEFATTSSKGVYVESRAGKLDGRLEKESHNIASNNGERNLHLNVDKEKTSDQSSKKEIASNTINVRDPSLRSSKRIRKKVKRYIDIVEYSGTYSTPTRKSSAKQYDQTLKERSDQVNETSSKKGEYWAEDLDVQAPSEWTSEQVQALFIAMAKVDPRKKNYWQHVSDMIPGRSAGECFDRSFAGHPTPKETHNRTRNRRKDIENASSVASMSALEAAAIKSTAPVEHRKRTAVSRAAEARKNARDMRWKYRAEELGIGTMDDPFGFENEDTADLDATDFFDQAKEKLIKDMKDQKELDQYIERHLKRRPKKGFMVDHSLEKKKCKGNMARTLAESEKAARASALNQEGSTQDIQKEDLEDDEVDHYF